MYKTPAMPSKPGNGKKKPKPDVTIMPVKKKPAQAGKSKPRRPM